MPNPVLIVGAGPVGLTMAAALLHHQIPCRVIEKLPVPSDKSKALVVWCRTLELLNGLGLAETFIQSGLKLTGGNIFAEGERLVHLKMTSDESPFGFPLMIPQNLTEKLLTDHLAQQGVVIERQCELTSFTETERGVTCLLQHEGTRDEVVETPFLIGCDGAHSTVRHMLGMEFTGHAEPNDWLLADVHVDGPLAREEVSIFWHDAGVAAFFPIDRTRVRMIADLGPVTGSLPAEQPTLADAQKMVDQRVSAGLTLSDPVWLAYFRINERKVADYRQGRVMLAGDAAHIHSPAGGQGMNTGMQDAMNLAWKIALAITGRGETEALLQSYSSERSAVGDQVLKNAERFTTMATLRNPIAQWLRNHIVPLLGSTQFVQDKIRDDWFEISINYRHSPLSGEHWPAFGGGLHAGDRLGDAALVSGNAGRKSSLFEICDSRRQTLLLFPASSEPHALATLTELAATIDMRYPELIAPRFVLPGQGTADASPAGADLVWMDSSGDLHHRLGVQDPTLLLVRPDGYIGFRSQPADRQTLLSHLSSYLK